MRKLLLALSFAVTAPLQAQWSPLPDGSYAYTFHYTSQAVFSCSFPLLPSSCLASGSTISFFNGTANATISFTEVSKTVTVPRGGVRLTGFEIGSFDIAFGGVGPFEWPPTTGQLHSLFAVTFIMRETSPIAAGDFASFHFRQRSPTEVENNCCGEDKKIFDWHMTLPPNGIPAEMVVDTFAPIVFGIGGPSTVAVTAAIQIVPEPGTWALMLVGLAGVGMLRKKRSA